jgi:hypothetical protein
MNRSIWSFETDMYGHFFFKEILIDLISYFPLSQFEALERINTKWEGFIFKEFDIIFHDLPDVWAAHLYWGNDVVWWKKGEERAQLGLPILKPLRASKLTTYELWEYIDAEDSDHIFISVDEKAELMARGILTKDYSLTWSVLSDHYVDARKRLHEFKGWTGRLSIS